MFWINFKRVIKSGFVSFWRNGFVSLSSVLVMLVTLFVTGSILFIDVVLNYTLDQVKDKVDVNVYFVTNAEESNILSIKKTIEGLAEVKSVEYISSEEALKEFKDKHQNDQLTLQALDELGSNPLGAVLNIKAKDTSQYEGIAKFLENKSLLSNDGTSIIDRVNYYQNKVAIDRLSEIISSSQTFGLILTIFLIIISIIITFNTIRLVIFISREEISVMRLVGASHTYIRSPFVVSGVMYGIISAIICLIIFYPITYWIRGISVSFFGGLDLFSYYVGHLGQFFMIIVGSGAVLGGISSYLAVRRYLKI